MGDRDEVEGDPHDPERPGDLIAGEIGGLSLPVPAGGHLAERACDLVGEAEAPGEEHPSLAEVRRGPREPPLAPGDLLCDQPCAGGHRAVVGEPADEPAHLLGGLGSRAEDLYVTLEVDLVAVHPAREVGRRPGAPMWTRSAT